MFSVRRRLIVKRSLSLVLQQHQRFHTLLDIPELKGILASGAKADNQMTNDAGRSKFNKMLTAKTNPW